MCFTLLPLPALLEVMLCQSISNSRPAVSSRCTSRLLQATYKVGDCVFAVTAGLQLCLNSCMCVLLYTLRNCPYGQNVHRFPPTSPWPCCRCEVTIPYKKTFTLRSVIGWLSRGAVFQLHGEFTSCAVPQIMSAQVLSPCLPDFILLLMPSLTFDSLSCPPHLPATELNNLLSPSSDTTACVH